LIFWERMVGVRAEVEKVYDLYIAGGIGVEQFKEINTPLHDLLGQLSAEVLKLEGETAPLAVSDLSVETIAHEARNIAALLPTLDTDGKQRLASTLCTGIIILNPAMGCRAKTQRRKEEADADKQAFTRRVSVNQCASLCVSAPLRDIRSSHRRI